MPTILVGIVLTLYKNDIPINIINICLDLDKYCMVLSRLIIQARMRWESSLKRREDKNYYTILASMVLHSD